MMFIVLRVERLLRVPDDYKGLEVCMTADANSPQSVPPGGNTLPKVECKPPPVVSVEGGDVTEREL